MNIEDHPCWACDHETSCEECEYFSLEDELEEWDFGRFLSGSPAADREEEECGDISPHWSRCTLPRGHLGPHEGGGESWEWFPGETTSREKLERWMREGGEI